MLKILLWVKGKRSQEFINETVDLETERLQPSLCLRLRVRAAKAQAPAHTWAAGEEKEAAGALGR